MCFAKAEIMQLARMVALCALSLLGSGCASLPLNLGANGFPLGKSGWQVSGGVDFTSQKYYLCLTRPLNGFSK